MESYSKYNSIGIEYNCPNDAIKFNQFINKTLNLIQTASIPSKIIESKIQNLREQLMNIDHQNPWEYSKFYNKIRIQSNEYLNTELLSVLDKITERDIKLFINEIFDDCTLTIFFFGNLTADQIPQNDITNKFVFNQHISFPKITIPQDLTINHPNINEKNNCVTFYYYIGSFSPLKWLHLFITELILENKFYDELRTKKQMGYLVHLGMTSSSDNYFLIEKIQSNKSCDEICIEINNFNDTIFNLLEESNLDEIKVAAKNHLKEKHNSIENYYNIFFNEIISRKYLFDRKKIILQQIKNITKDSIKEFINEYIYNNQYKSIFKLNGNA